MPTYNKQVLTQNPLIIYFLTTCYADIVVRLSLSQRDLFKSLTFNCNSGSVSTVGNLAHCLLKVASSDNTVHVVGGLTGLSLSVVVASRGSSLLFLAFLS